MTPDHLDLVRKNLTKVLLNTERSFVFGQDPSDPESAVLHVFAKEGTDLWQDHLAATAFNKLVAKSGGLPLPPTVRTCGGTVTLSDAGTNDFTIRAKRGVGESALVAGLKTLNGPLRFGGKARVVQGEAVRGSDGPGKSVEEYVYLATSHLHDLANDASTVSDAALDQLVRALDKLAALGNLTFDDGQIELALAEVRKRERARYARRMGKAAGAGLQGEAKAAVRQAIGSLYSGVLKRLTARCDTAKVRTFGLQRLGLQNAMVDPALRLDEAVIDDTYALALEVTAGRLLRRWLTEDGGAALLQEGAKAGVEGVKVAARPLLDALEGPDSPITRRGVEDVRSALDEIVLSKHPAEQVRRKALDVFLGRSDRDPKLVDDENGLTFGAEALGEDPELQDPQTRLRMTRVKERKHKGRTKWVQQQVRAIEQQITEWLAFRSGPGSARRYHNAEDLEKMADWLRLEVLAMRSGVGSEDPNKQEHVAETLELVNREGERLLKRIFEASFDPIDDVVVIARGKVAEGETLEIGDLTLPKLEALGSGAVAQIFRTIRVTPDGAVPCVVRSVSLSENRTEVVREGRLARKLDHPRIIRTFDVAMVQDGEDERLVTVNELATGDAQQLMLPGPGIPVDQRARDAKRRAKEVLEGLLYLHGEGWAHLDLKPANLLVMPDGSLKITDFGESRHRDEPLTTYVGTSAYNPPEMATVQGRLGMDKAKCDAFALGCVLYQMVTGRLLVDDVPCTTFDPTFETCTQNDVDGLFLAPIWAQAELATPGITQACRALTQLDPTARSGCDVVQHLPFFA